MPQRSPRADALRNRIKILAAASDAFARDGAEVPLDTIAVLAGVGPGTVHRHFPTKQSLVSAVVASRLGRLAERAEQHTAVPAASFFEFLAELAGEARHNLVLTEALGGTLGADVEQSAYRLSRALESLLHAAQRSGAVRPDLTVSDLHAIIIGALAMEHRLTADHQGLGLEIVLQGLKNW
ncbi:MAG TPA: TetR/AcrR family transcriptional regulator [Streptosporangiaceae bacterium]|nr:TetR/AcrR family transcriptional regulator [Streptosporangiaceae bacterium]